ncbi:hypothetical protein [Aureimonas sp. ME7]|uniref:hypothetical protein n=1 Tax=Aureimonas sp. ME7 TaxID=2744252 RepID=UPI0015FBD117|nr:hypothetical protein [Aureimonas sp. ME7]
MHGPKPFTTDIDGGQLHVQFEEFGVMTDECFDAPLVTGTILVKLSDDRVIRLEYEEWIDELVEGMASRWLTGTERNSWKDALYPLNRDGVGDLRSDIDRAVYRRLSGSTWRTHL